MASFFQRVSEVVYREYDRRIKRASLVTEYGAPHHAAEAHADHDGHTDAGIHDVDESAIANVSPGTSVEEDEGAVVIANVPRGSMLGQEQAPESKDHTGSSSESR
jgi:hypothetical protein